MLFELRFLSCRMNLFMNDYFSILIKQCSLIIQKKKADLFDCCAKRTILVKPSLFQSSK